MGWRRLPALLVDPATTRAEIGGVSTAPEGVNSRAASIMDAASATRNGRRGIRMGRSCLGGGELEFRRRSRPVGGGLRRVVVECFRALASLQEPGTARQQRAAGRRFAFAPGRRVPASVGEA